MKANAQPEIVTKVVEQVKELEAQGWSVWWDPAIVPGEEFDRLIPVEFWREVVDTVAERAPDTLLLAEAFWMMEGYFVRTLGMHRVYNSAFMNMLKREENERVTRSGPGTPPL